MRRSYHAIGKSYSEVAYSFILKILSIKMILNGNEVDTMNKVAIVGAGPSALFAAKTILENSINIEVEIFEIGKNTEERLCFADKGVCKKCDTCGTLQGVGGAGLFSDGKLVLDLTSGGKAEGIKTLDYSEQKALENSIKETFIQFDGLSEFKAKPNQIIQEQIRSSFEEKGLSIKFYDVLHMGTHNLEKITNGFVSFLADNYSERFKLYCNVRVIDIQNFDNGFILHTSDGDFKANSVIIGVGKTGASWLAALLNRLGNKLESHDFYFGFRLEMPYEGIVGLIEYSLDPKVYQIKSGRKIKMHCVCRKGGIRYSRYKNNIIVGGHTPLTSKNNNNTKEFNTSFNILVSFDKISHPPETILNAFRSLNNDKAIVQKLGDFINDDNTTEWGAISPENQQMTEFGNIREIMDSIDHDFSNLAIDFLNSLSRLYPDVLNSDNLIYAPAIEWDMDTVCVDKNMETTIKNIYAIGDGAGLSQGIVYSAATGIIAARAICKRYGKENQ
jgi:uncharacterized FAD-dependent dehydrogenase